MHCRNNVLLKLSGEYTSPTPHQSVLPKARSTYDKFYQKTIVIENLNYLTRLKSTEKSCVFLLFSLKQHTEIV